MDENKQKLLLGMILIFLIFSLVPQIYRLWQTIQMPFEQLFSLPDLWSQLGLLLLTPSLLLAVSFSLPFLEIDERDVLLRPVTYNLIAAGVLELVAAWRAYQVGSSGIAFYLLLSIFCFSAPALLKNLRVRFDTHRSPSN